MNAANQAITPELVSKIANLSVLFRAEFYNARVDLSPWLTDAETQRQADPHSIDLSFHFTKGRGGLVCNCVLMQVQFSEGLLQPTCKLVGVEAKGYDRTELRWDFSTASNSFAGKCVPDPEYQSRFRRLVRSIARLFESPNQVRNHSDHHWY
ncbi:MAG: hypothetical protein AAGH78_05605 [Cyanobacteria bacterium P01_H01_bin.58]